jgi:acyl carrier protein
MNTLPLTQNGKMTGMFCPFPDRSKPKLAENFIAPCSQIEKQLAAIWASILCIEKVGIHENFFELGGHSLLDAQVMSRLKAVFDIDLPVRTLFELPTVAELTERVEAINWATQYVRVNGDHEEGEL